MADVKFEVTRFALTNGSAGSTQDITISGFGTPKAAIFLLSRADTDDTVSTGESNFSVGFFDGTNQYACDCNSGIGYSTSETSRGHSASVIRRTRPDAVLTNNDFIGDSFITDGVRIEVVNATSTQWLCTLILIGGADVSNSFVGSKVMSTTAARDVTNVGFEADLVFAAGIGYNSAAPAIGGSSQMSFGAAINDGATPTQKCIQWEDRDDETDTIVTTKVMDNKIGGKVFNSSSDYAIEIDDFDASGFTLTPTASAQTHTFGFLALKFSNSPDISLIDVTIPTSGNYAETAPGFEPTFGLLALMEQGSATINTVDAAGGGAMAVAAFDSSAVYTACIASEDAVTTSDGGSLSSDQLRVLNPDASADSLLAAKPVLDSLGWDSTITTNPGSAMLGWGLAVGVGAGGSVTGTVGQATETDTALAITPVTAVSATLGQATETDTALAITPVTHVTGTLGQATETDTALALTPVSAVTGTVGQATETDTALAITPVTAVAATLGQATETDTALALTPVTHVSATLGQATETDTALGITPTIAVSAVLGQATETDTALSITPVTAVAATLGQATETDTALTITPLTTVIATLGQATETDTALSITPSTVLATVSCSLVDRNGNALPGLTSLSWAWFDSTDPATFGSPVVQGGVESTDGTGLIELDLPGTTLTSGQQGTLVLRSDDGTTLGAYNLAVA